MRLKRQSSGYDIFRFGGLSLMSSLILKHIPLFEIDDESKVGRKSASERRQVMDFMDFTSGINCE